MNASLLSTTLGAAGVNQLSTMTIRLSGLLQLRRPKKQYQTIPLIIQFVYWSNHGSIWQICNDASPYVSPLSFPIPSAWHEVSQNPVDDVCSKIICSVLERISFVYINIPSFKIVPVIYYALMSALFQFSTSNEVYIGISLYCIIYKWYWLFDLVTRIHGVLCRWKRRV